MFYACAARFDVTENLKNSAKLPKSIAQKFRLSITSIFAVRA
jgi:hypothetical protein